MATRDWHSEVLVSVQVIVEQGEQQCKNADPEQIPGWDGQGKADKPTETFIEWVLNRAYVYNRMLGKILAVSLIAEASELRTVGGKFPTF